MDDWNDMVLRDDVAALSKAKPQGGKDTVVQHGRPDPRL